MQIKAYAKINWALDILERREDGYHIMDMLMQSIDLCDELSFADASENVLVVNGRRQEQPEKNLIVKAVNALNAFTGEKRAVRAEVIKRIPERAGLGGGSADCAAALRALNEMWRLRLRDDELMRIGLKLGADVPYCVKGGFCRVSGIGEIVREAAGAREKALVIARVGEGLSTQAVFMDFDSHADGALGIPLDEVTRAIQADDFARALRLSGNALERAAVRLMPEIQAALESMLSLGAAYARMSGSGSTVYGVFENEEAAARAQELIPNAMRVKTLAGDIWKRQI